MTKFTLRESLFGSVYVDLYYKVVDRTVGIGSVEQCILVSSV